MILARFFAKLILNEVSKSGIEKKHLTEIQTQLFTSRIWPEAWALTTYIEALIGWLKSNLSFVICNILSQIFSREVVESREALTL